MRPSPTLASIAWLLVVASPSNAQSGDTARVSARPLFTRRDAVVAGGVAVATAVLTQFDRDIARRLRAPGLQSNSTYRDASSQLKRVQEVTLSVTSAALYTVGRVGNVPRAADLGLHASEAIAITWASAALIKSALGRARPFVDSTDAGLFRPGRGFTDGRYRSFPSLHEGAAFAFAAVVAGETGMWWPRSRPIVTPLVYGGASLVGLARMYTNKHWASDVVAGSALGAFAGAKVVRYSHSHPRNRIDRWLLRTSAGSRAQAPMLVFTRAFGAPPGR